MSSTYRVEGMTCDHCRAAVENHVGAVPGVTAVAVDLATGTVLVEGDPEDRLVRDAIVEAGYAVA
ncbi:MAG: heavy-metal-associated domain-containing protein [Thermoleophilia bacterium]|nr:heavy-metal-associated domain-containing protein [Thermoleophilia bacterium]